MPVRWRHGAGAQIVALAIASAGIWALTVAAQAVATRASDRALARYVEDTAGAVARAVEARGEAALGAARPAEAVHLRLIRLDGTVAAADGGAGPPVPAATARAAALTGRAVVSPPSRGEDLGQALMPLRGPEGAVVGLAQVTVDVGRAREAVVGAMVGAGAGAALLAALAMAGLGLALRKLRLRKDAAEDEVRRLARHDPLTGLPNREGFGLEAGALIARAAREGGCVAVICADIDRFRAINDLHGREAGDAVLRAAARSLSGALRRGDALGRIAADEFAIAVPLASEDEAPALLERLAARLTAGVAAGAPAAATASFGACIATADGEIEAALGRAGMALREARAAGPGAGRAFHPEMEARMRRRQCIEAALLGAPEEGRASLDYQPIVAARGGATLGCEALMRLRTADGASIPPSEFIPVAEETGRIVALGAWALRTATAEAARWPEGLRVSVNLSARQFEDGALIATVRDALAASGLAAERLELEVTESLLISDPDGAEGQLAALRAMGVSVAMDDFGAGHSSLAYLWRFGFDRLKLDRSFAHALATEAERARDVVGAIAALGRRLGMKVVAEGIETKAEADAFAALGCDEMQGYRFARPMPAAALHEVLAWTEDAALERKTTQGRAARGAAQASDGRAAAG